MARKKVVENVENEVVKETITEPVADVPADEPAVATGEVTNCVKLNVRKKPDSKSAVIAILDCKTKVTIDLASSTDTWLNVTLGNGNKGYCMKEHIKLV